MNRNLVNVAADRDSKLSIDDFVDNVKSAITSRGLPPSKQANFILLYLDWPVKEEMKLSYKIGLKEPD